MRKEPLISVIVNVYDSVSKLKKCLDTLLLQLYKNIEIICIDNGLSAEVTEILYSYKVQHDKFEIIHHTDSNSASAWNDGLKLAKGEYIHFINSNCWALLDLYKVFVNEAINKTADIGIINSALYNEKIIDIPFFELFDDEDLIKNSDDMIYSYRDIRHIMTKNLRVFNKIYKKEFLEKQNLSFSESNNYSEYLFNVQTLIKSSPVYINPETYMRHREQIITDGANTEKVFDIFNTITDIQNFLFSENMLSPLVFDFFNFICNSLDKYYKLCPNDRKQTYFYKMKCYILSRFESMPNEVQNNLLNIDELKFLITSDYVEYNNKKQS